ncbi:MAG TPA: hypothetical protein PKD09_17875 [Aggregatilinea sp.]|uniref:hypothetical protein n=1 Tax=Aggregatilinea sp. TaxID=2806333 RepID=UPI002C8342E2|nr:hypothetical protein [Aggregatilinea sp.]HML23530.1 hypothetical protein [Aggregatilinea sp.]
MTDPLAVPAWITTYLAQAQAWLGLEHYTLSVRLEDALEDETGKEYVLRAHVKSNFPYPDARIQVTPHVEDDPRGRESLLHELLHVAIEPANRVVAHICEMTESEQQGQALWRLYEDAHEHSVSLMARGLATALDVPALPETMARWMETSLDDALHGDYAMLREAAQAVLDALRKREGAETPEEANE